MVPATDQRITSELSKSTLAPWPDVTTATPSAARTPEALPQGLLVTGSEADEGLIRQQHPGTARKRKRQRDPHPFTAGQAPALLFQQVPDINDIDRVGDPSGTEHRAQGLEVSANGIARRHELTLRQVHQPSPGQTREGLSLTSIAEA